MLIGRQLLLWPVPSSTWRFLPWKQSGCSAATHSDAFQPVLGPEAFRKCTCLINKELFLYRHAWMISGHSGQRGRCYVFQFQFCLSSQWSLKNKHTQIGVHSLKNERKAKTPNLLAVAFLFWEKSLHLHLKAQLCLRSQPPTRCHRLCGDTTFDLLVTQSSSAVQEQLSELRVSPTTYPLDLVTHISASALSSLDLADASKQCCKVFPIKSLNIL